MMFTSSLTSKLSVTLRTLTAVLAAVTVWGCGIPTPLPPPPPPTPTVRLIQATIRATTTNEAPVGIEVKVRPEIEGRPWTACEMVESRARCNLPLDWPGHPFGAWLQAEAPGFDRVDVRFLWDGVGNLEDIYIRPEFVALPRLIVNGKFFALQGPLGHVARVTLIEATDFNLFGRYLNGEDINPVLAQRNNLGFNLLRVFTAINVNGIGRLVPSEHPDYYTRIPGFLQTLARHSLYAELVGFTGPYQGILDGDDAKVAHWDRLIEAVQGQSNVLLELVNEYDHTANRDIPFSRLKRPTGVLSSHGSGQADSPTLTPVWDYGTYHPGFGSEWPRKAVHNGMEDVADKHNIPVLVNETTRFPDNDSSLSHAFDVGRGCALLQAGCAFHSVTGKVSQLWSGVELNLAKEWAGGAQSLNLHCQSGSYVRRDDLLTPERSRVYQRVGTGIDDACIAIVRK